jgi:hypothetical protein
MNQVKSVIIGYRRGGSPIWQIAGSEPEDGPGIFIEDDDSDDDSDDSDDDFLFEQPTAGAGEDWPPSREEWESLRSTARKATQQAVERKRLLREAGLPLKRRKAAAPDGDDRQAAFDEARKKAAQESTTERALAKLALRAALHEAGWSGGDTGLATRMIDFGKVAVEVSDDGEVSAEGLAEQIEEIREAVPTWFRRRKGGGERTETVGAATVDGGVRGTPPTAKKGWQAAMSDQLARGRRR